jgi:hypothetical protein
MGGTKPGSCAAGRPPQRIRSKQPSLDLPHSCASFLHGKRCGSAEGRRRGGDEEGGGDREYLSARGRDGPQASHRRPAVFPDMATARASSCNSSHPWLWRGVSSLTQPLIHGQSLASGSYKCGGWGTCRGGGWWRPSHLTGHRRRLIVRRHDELGARGASRDGARRGEGCWVEETELGRAAPCPRRRPLLEVGHAARRPCRLFQRGPRWRQRGGEAAR